MKNPKFLGIPIPIDQDYWTRIADTQDESIKKAIIGSRITSFEVKQIKNRKRMLQVTITTDAPTVVPIVGSKNAFVMVNPISFRIKT